MIFREGQLWLRTSPSGGFIFLVLKTEGSLHGSTQGWAMWDHDSIITRANGRVNIGHISETVEKPYEQDIERMTRIL